ncbi:nucleolar pre-ribosomal-associated protein 1 [Thalassophryne amazonica]|uniref:nucleolar pre-ribosomal-associated protein 1 n=1 Tax=Thalassophryne amazonica TaxID=390379 RepID=UPI00147203B3|nr:nucleolar pre-ribosomal-associated protein 1 [Thalassophryne amazonica]
MVKRRGSVDSVESNGPRNKQNVPEFNGTVFKGMLKDATTATKGLTTFISIAEKLPCPGLYDVVEGYIKISMECAEIFKLLEGDKQNESEMMLIFKSLEMILLRTASDLSHFSMVGNAIVKKIVSSHMKRLQASFHTDHHRFVRRCLSLLTALVSQGREAARDVLNNLHINKGLSGLARRRDTKGRLDVRMAFIQFVLSFLVSGDNPMIGQILEVKELLPEILTTGLKEDRLSIVGLILSTLKSKVVWNKAISKTQKVRFFTPAVLANIASLYKWNGIVDANAEDPTIEGCEDAGLSVVRELVHSFLLDLCCSRKHGISFHDISFGTAERLGNIVLLQFLVGLKSASEDELVAELVVNVLKASPDILSRYFKETQHSYTPRLRSAWQDSVKLLKKIYEAQPEISTVFQRREVIPLPRLLAIIMVISFPPVCNKAFFTQGLNFSNVAVLHTTFSMLSFILKRANKNLEYLTEKSEWHSSHVYTCNTMDDFVQRYRETVSKILPDMTHIVAKWQHLTKMEMTEGDEKKAKNEETEDKNEMQAADSTEVIFLKALILQVISLYQKVVPHLVSQCKFDFSKLLKGIVSATGIGEEVPPVLQYQMLQLALDLPANKFSWFRMQESADADTCGEKSVLYLLLNMFVNSSSSHLKTTTRMLVLKILKNSGAFEYTWTELELWLNQLARVDSNHQESVIVFLEKVLVKLVHSSYIYTDKVASLVQDAASVQANLSSQDEEAASIPVSHIDDVLDMLDVIMEGNERQMEEFGPSLSEELIMQTFPFSVVVPSALEARNKLPADKGMVHEYLCTVLSDVLHCQREPIPLCLALLHYDKELISSEHTNLPHPSIIRFHHYYSKWLPQQCQEDLFKSFECSSKSLPTRFSFTELMKVAYQRGPAAFLEDNFRKNVEDSLAVMSVDEFPVAVMQTLLYIKATVEDFGTFFKDTAAAFLMILMTIIQDLVIKLQNIEENSTTQEDSENVQEGSDLFMNVDQLSTVKASKEQVLVSSLGSIFKHPCLEQWFLALELASLPPHNLNPVRLKYLCAQLSDDILALLKLSAPILHGLGHLELISSYMDAVERAALRELQEKMCQTTKKRSRPFQALLALHSYMTSSNVMEVASKLLLLPQESLISPSGEDAQAKLSVYGHTALQILTDCGANPSQDHSIFLSQAHLQGLATLLLSCSSPALEAFLLRTLSTEPGSAKLIHTDVLLHCLQQPLPAAQAISTLLLQNSSTHRLQFEMWCLKPANIEKLSDQAETFLPLINTYLQVAGREDPARPKDVQKNVLKMLKQVLLTKLTNIILGNLMEDVGSLHAETLSHLIRLSANIKDIRDLINNLPDALQRVDSFERWQLVDVITEKLTDCSAEQESWRKSVTAAALKCLIASFSHFRVQTVSPPAHEPGILEKLQRLLNCAEGITASEWNSFIKNGLKYRYRDHHFLNTLSSLLERMYGGNKVPMDLTPLSTVHMMTSSHSLFLPSMLDTDEQLNCETKEALVSLLLCLVKKCPEVCNVSHFVVFLGAYGATLSTFDQKMLLLLQEYEKNNVSLLKFQSFLWGPAAVEHHKMSKSLGASLWKQANSDDVLSLLKPDKMLQTILRFPQKRTIIPLDGEDVLYCNETVKDAGSLYDPCFLLALFSAILRPECVIDCLKFVSCHALGVSVMALSSYDLQVRAAGYHVLSCFYHHLEGASFREKRQLLYLLDMVRNGVRQQNQRLPFILTTYITKVAQQMLKPEDHMYVVLNRFLLSHQSLDFRRVPEFFKLFYGFDLEHKMEREWILKVLEEGMADGYCYKLCNQQSIFQSLLGFSSSPLCDEHIQAQIIRVLCQTARVTKAAYNLTKNCGLLTWILQMVEKRQVEQHLLSAVIDLLHILWFTLLGDKCSQADGSSTSPGREKKAASSVKCLPLPLIGEFLYVGLSIIRHLRSGVKTAQLGLFLQMLSSVLEQRWTSLCAKRQANQLTLEPQPLTCTEVLILLQCWAFLSHNAALLTQIHVLSEKYKVRELLGTAKQKAHGKGFLSQAHAQKQNLAEDTGMEKREETLLADCKFYLSSIFVHWEPVIPLTVPRTAEQSDTEVPSHLVRDTAHLLTWWCLRCLVEKPYDENGTKVFLHWFEKAVIKHWGIVDVVLLDGGLKADLLRLYHRVFEDQCHSTLSAQVETIQLFTDIMLNLLETRGLLPELHQTVVSACLKDVTMDQSRREAGLFLLSLYIHELWSEGKSAELFLSHVSLVSRAKCKRQKSSKSSVTRTAIRDICNDIIAMHS